MAAAPRSRLPLTIRFGSAIYFACEIKKPQRGIIGFIYLLNVAQRRLQRWMAAQPQNEVTPAQAGLLFILGKQDGVLMGEAGAALDMGPAGISGLVDRSAAARLVERRADREDGRAWRVWLTPKGRTVLTQAKTDAAQINAALTDGFTSAEIDIVARWLTSIQDKFPRPSDD
ncbi:DNA-binding MarR family transcriptional regulator [Bradyrhizobium sp. i1.3.1]